jgi:aminoglycoside phosphotransferase (APT) family kinase protein
MKAARDTIRPQPRHGWLAAVLPAAARRFRTQDPELQATLALAGADIVEKDPDVEIGTVEDLHGDAACAIVELRAAEPRGDFRLRRGAQRLARFAGMRVRIAWARRALRRRGYAAPVALTWERGVMLRAVGRQPPPARRLAHRFPLNAVVVGNRTASRQTAFEAAVAAAERDVGRQLAPSGLVLGSSGVIVATTSEGVMRVAIGPAARRIEEQRLALDALRDAQPSAVVSERVPSILAHGRTGVASWSLERRLPGQAAPPRLPARLLEDCIEFLASLHQVEAGDGDRPSCAADAALVAELVEGAADRLLELGRRLDSDLADLPRGFAHGDFWRGNLLTAQDQLVGVTDWPAGGPKRLPLLDLLNLEANVWRELFAERLATTVVNRLLPQARAGGGSLERSYLRLIGIELTSKQLEALVAAYWLQALARGILDPDQDAAEVGGPIWTKANLEGILDAMDSRQPRPANGCGV